MEQHYARRALDEFFEEHGKELEKGAMVAVRLLPEGEVPGNPFAAGAGDEASAAAEVEAMLRRHNLIN